MEKLNNLYLLRKLGGDQSKFEYLQAAYTTRFGERCAQWTENAKHAAHYCDRAVAEQLAEQLAKYDVLCTVIVSQRGWTL